MAIKNLQLLNLFKVTNKTTINVETTILDIKSNPCYYDVSDSDIEIKCQNGFFLVISMSRINQELVAGDKLSFIDLGKSSFVIKKSGHEITNQPFIRQNSGRFYCLV